MNYLKSVYRTHTCAELRPEHIGVAVVLSGWIMRKRDHGGVVFVDLRDNYGVTQIVFNDSDKEKIQDVRVESVITVAGKVIARDATLVNDRIATGTIEVVCEQLTVQSTAAVLPFLIAEDDNAGEAIRLKARFLELRREKLHTNILLRSAIMKRTRQIMEGIGFTEFQTPILTSSSPEGARDFIVPSRLHPGNFYALPQAPQQFKQLLMVAGFDRYFQIAPCFRDEDSRADRSPGEFYQLDLEMSFVEQEDVLNVIEEYAHTIFTSFANGKAVTNRPFPRIPYDESVARFGSDKPDLRNPLEIKNVSEVFADTEFKVFKNVLDAGGTIQCIPMPVDSIPPRSYFDGTVEWFKKLTGQGLAYLSYDETGEPKSSIVKFFKPELLENLKTHLGITTPTSLFFAAGPTKKILPWLGKVRDKLAEDFDLLEKDCFKLCIITDYPQFEYDEKQGKIDFGHNPFSMPRGGLEALKTQDPLEIYANQYDVVCNGFELGSGAIRNHDPEVMYKAFEIAGYDRSVVDHKFGGMIRAFKFGAPPHGGFAFGMDRIVMLCSGETTIREVIGFPLAQTGEDLLMGAPSQVTPQQLKDVHIALDLPPEYLADAEEKQVL